MVRPAISRSRSREIVSVSGSSGTLREFGPSRQLAPPDVGSELLSLELDRRGELPAPVARLHDRVPEAGHRKDAPARRDEIAGGIALGSGMKDERIARHRRNLNSITRAGFLRISARGEYGGHRGLFPGKNRIRTQRLAARHPAHRIRERLAELKGGQNH